jgi:trk system potassium uptake protein TrkA
MKILIIGSGKILYFLCRNFTSAGYDVVIINRNLEECQSLARELKAKVVHGDGSDVKVLMEAGAMGADVVLAITPHDQDNLIICQLAAIQFSVPRAVALANDPDNVEIFEQLGVRTFSTALIIGNLIEQRASLEQIINLLPIGGGRVNVTEILLDEESPVTGKHLKNITLPENVLIAVLIRNGQPIIPGGATQLRAGDRIVLVTMPANHGPALKAITGKKG